MPVAGFWLVFKPIHRFLAGSSVWGNLAKSRYMAMLNTSLATRFHVLPNPVAGPKCQSQSIFALLMHIHCIKNTGGGLPVRAKTTKSVSKICTTFFLEIFGRFFAAIVRGFCE